MKENRGQVSLEYMLIFSVSLMILIAFTLPFLEKSMDNTFDVSESLKTKSDLSKIAHAIRQVYGQGQGSKQSVNVDVNVPVKMDISSNQITSKIKLKNGDNKAVKINVKSKLKTDTFKLSKGRHTFVVEWPVGSENMRIYQK